MFKRFFTPNITITMSALLLSFLGLSVGMPHCPMWKEIAPCSCRMDSTKLTTIQCDRMGSYEQVVNLLRGHFAPTDRVSLRISFSKLDDLPMRNFRELNVSIENLKLNHDNLGELEGATFDSLNNVGFFSLADNHLGKVPEHLWRRMPGVRTLDLGRNGIRTLSASNFRGLPATCVVLAGNQISQMESDTFPREIQRLHLGRNNLYTLNKTITNLSDLVWLFANSNNLTDIEGELPMDAKKLKMIHFSNNRISKLPQQMRTLTSLDSLFFQYNALRSLDGALSKCKRLMRVVLEDNLIETLSPDDFTENEILESLLLGNNRLRTLNNSLVHLKNLNFLNVSYNYLTEFHFQDIVGLHRLRSIDLSFNRIKTLIGPTANVIDWNFKLTEIKLDHNEIESLDGALSGLPELMRLNLSFNKLTRISPDDLIGLDELRLLDVSHNYLTTLEEMSKTYLPRLEELKASHNYLTLLERDFHGLPVLCHADLSNNQIVALGRELVSKTKCKIGHGVHEGTWDTLKIYLQDNPILCDAALPEIMSTMEINHTRLYGVSHCPPLSEQPVTTKPNGFLGYIPPETTPSLPAAISANHQHKQLHLVQHQVHQQDIDRQNHQVKTSSSSQGFKTPAYEAVQLSIPINDVNNASQQPTEQQVDLKKTGQYRVENAGNVLLQNDGNATLPNNSKQPNSTENTVIIDPVKQEKQLVKLASELEELRTRVEELANQNQILLSQQLPGNKILNENTDETRKP